MSDKKPYIAPKKKDYVGIYKPNRNNNGACAQLKISSDRECMFLEFAPQVRPGTDAVPFDWSKDKKICVKIGVTDIGKILSLFNCVLPLNEDKNKPDLELFHKTGSGNKTIKFKVQQNGYYIKVTMQDGGKLSSLAMPCSWDEAELLKIALTRGYEIILGW